MHRHPITPLGRQVLWLISSMVLCIVVPLLLHEATGGPNNTRIPWWPTAIILVSGAAYAGVIASQRRQLFGMVLWLFTYIFMGLAPYVQRRLDVLPGTTPRVDVSLFPAAGALVLACSVAVLAGNALAGRGHAPASAPPARTVDPQKAHLLTAAGVALFLYYGAQIGYSSFLHSRTELSEIRAATWPDTAEAALLTGGLHMVLLVAFIAQLTVRRQHVGRRKPNVLPTILTGTLLLYTVNPISSPRYVFGTVALAMLAALGAYATITRFRIMAGAALVGMLALFPLADVFRHSTSATLDAEGPVLALTTGDFDAFNQLINTLSYVEAHGLTWGQQLLGVLLFWVPRSLWPGKPEDTGIVVAEHMGYGFTNLSAPLWSEWFINFGTVGAVVGMFALGYCFRRIDNRTELHLRFSPIPPVAVCAISFYLLIVLRGSLLNAASYLLVIALASWFVTKRPRSGKRFVLREHPPITGVGGVPAVSEPDDRLVR